MNEILILIILVAMFAIGALIGGMIDLYIEKKEKKRKAKAKAFKAWKKSHKLFVGQIEK